MWYMFAASYQQLKRSVEELISESIQFTCCFHEVNLISVRQLLSIANNRDLRAIWKPYDLAWLVPCEDPTELV